MRPSWFTIFNRNICVVEVQRPVWQGKKYFTSLVRDSNMVSALETTDILYIPPPSGLVKWLLVCRTRAAAAGPRGYPSSFQLGPRVQDIPLYDDAKVKPQRSQRSGSHHLSSCLGVLSQKRKAVWLHSSTSLWVISCLESRGPPGNYTWSNEAGDRNHMTSFSDDRHLLLCHLPRQLNLCKNGANLVILGVVHFRWFPSKTVSSWLPFIFYSWY